MQQINVLAYLERSANTYPDKTAFVDEKKSVTFCELLTRAKRLGTALASLGARRRPVAVLCLREADAVVGMLGVLYSGNFYVPIDPQTPEGRLASIRDKAKPAAVVYTEKTKRYLTPWGETPAVSVDADREIDEALLASVRQDVIDTDPAYMIFTSGSTGVPKGVVVSHRSVIDLASWFSDACGIRHDDILANQAPFFFDGAVKNLYAGLVTGCTVHILPKKFFSFPAALMDYIETNQITVLSWATSAMRLVANTGILQRHAPKCIRLVIVGGEALHGKILNLWRDALPQTQYINLYGPTETTVDCTCFKIERSYADEDMIPIGKACRNKRVLLLGPDGQPVPKGAPGEICVTGSGVALGYYGEREKTAEVFIQNPMNPYYREVMYCTGDIGVENDDGDIVYLARKDNQVKHMGYRIELGEIEAAAGSAEGVDDAICLFDGDRDVIHCVLSGDVTEADVKAVIARRLPSYMLPGEYHILPRLPMTPNGKIDRLALRKELIRDDI